VPADARAELAKLGADDRCCPGCPGWGVFHSDSRGWEVEVCDSCVRGTSRETLTDAMVAEFPEAQAQLTRDSEDSLRCARIHCECDGWDGHTCSPADQDAEQHPLAQGNVPVTCPVCLRHPKEK
jgi:hypothetical protein